MIPRKITAFLFILVAVVLGIIFYSRIEFPYGLEKYFDKEYYDQFAALAICVELLIAGIYLLRKNPNTNFALALFAFTAILDPVFNALGLFSSIVPLYGTIIFFICALPAMWIAFTDRYKLGKLSAFWALASFTGGVIIELFFNYW